MLLKDKIQTETKLLLLLMHLMAYRKENMDTHCKIAKIIKPADIIAMSLSNNMYLFFEQKYTRVRTITTR